MINVRDNIQVVLVNTRFPENIGMAARACGNMGVNNLSLVKPELWAQPEHELACNNSAHGGMYVEKALTLATGAGKEIIKNVKVCASLNEALAETTLSFGTTARTGGWRQGIISPAAAAKLAAEHLKAGGKISLVFGPEDKGLSNTAIEQCSHLVHIATSSEPSLNLAQAVLVLLYEFSREIPFTGLEKNARSGRIKISPLITHNQHELLVDKLKEAMLALGSLPGDNSGYFLLPLRRFLARSQIRHNEYSIIMGICSKILRLTGKNGIDS